MNKTYPEKCVTCPYFEHFASCYACSTCKTLQNSIVNDIDESESILLRLTSESVIMMTVHGETKTYRPIKAADDSWDMDVVGKTNESYGLSCESLKELKYLLLADYATGIITHVD